MLGGWELFRKSATSETWTSFYADPGDYDLRNRAGFAAFRVNDDGQPSRTVLQFKLRGYPFAFTNGQPDKTRYVESDWIARARGDDNFYCESPIANPNAGPQNMP